MLSTDRVQYIEPVVIEDIYVSILGGLEDVGDGNLRYTFCASQVSPFDGSTIENVVKARLVAGPTLIWLAIKATLRHWGVRCCGAMPRKKTTH